MAGQKSSNCKEITEVVFLQLGAVVGAIGCLSRADYNLPIFLFTYVITKYFNDDAMDQVNQFFCLILMMWSFAVDALFLIFVAGDLWATPQWKQLAGWETGVHTCTWVVCCIGMGIKLGYILFKLIGDGKDMCTGFMNMFCCCCVKKSVKA